MTQRSIEPKLVDFFREKLKDNGLYKQAKIDKNPRIIYGQANTVLVGIMEKTGKNDGEMVELLQRTVGGNSNESYCMSTQQSCIALAEEETGIESPIVASELCTHVWAHTPIVQRVKYFPLPYAMFIEQHGRGPLGHTGMILGGDTRIYQTVEGNVISGQIERGGKTVRTKGGVFFEDKRMFDTGNGTILLGFLKPF